MTVTTCIFDAYGTLFDVAAAARNAANEPGRERFAAHWKSIASNWRLKQLQYTWLRAIMNRHADFWDITCDSLDWSLEAEGLGDDSGLRETLLNLYWELDAYPEVKDMLKKLKSKTINTAILSNGSPPMLKAAVNSAKIGKYLDDVLSVESVGIFKPSDAVYNLATERFGCERHEVLFVSSNGWDACAAATYGFRTAWVNRMGEPVERLTAKPDHIVASLARIPELAN
ncbi:MAG: haloacid dehalogenase type II [Roseovarius sp.]|nr:haloacid dehalogenase type II [Roseovarius sp.]MCY4290279.1 haloacid dehalogenase type II [Roseovarius sp.]MCY4315342.1 haloacid dehalogenase type II [Roseovarius sp.]